jgi:hypothetical protein
LTRYKKGGEVMTDWSNRPENRLSVAEAAYLLNTSEQFIRIGLQQGTLKFGMAVKMSGQWTYVITKQKFEEVTGIKVL